MMMKRTLILLMSCIPTLAGAAETNVHWAAGVTETGGWYDFDKTFSGDDNMCWAAAACNVLAWWQDRNPALTSAAGAPTGEAVWTTFKQSFKNSDGETQYAMDWYFTGEAPDLLVMANRTEYGKTQGGYYESLLTGQPQYGYSFLMSMQGYDFTDARVYSSTLCRLLDDGYGVTLGIHGIVNGTTYGHALTLWGAEVDPVTGVLSRIWVTDSDDSGDYGDDNKLVVLNCSIKQNTTGKTQYITFESDPLPNGTRRYPLNEAVLNTFVAVKADASAWMEYPAEAPEPGTGTLSLLALAALCSRRWRHTNA